VYLRCNTVLLQQSATHCFFVHSLLSISSRNVSYDALQKTPKTSETRGKKRDGSHHDSSAKPAKQRKSTSSGDALSPSLSPKASIDFDDALVAHPSGKKEERRKCHVTVYARCSAIIAYK